MKAAPKVVETMIGSPSTTQFRRVHMPMGMANTSVKTMAAEKARRQNQYPTYTRGRSSVLPRSSVANPNSSPDNAIHFRPLDLGLGTPISSSAPITKAVNKVSGVTHVEITTAGGNTHQIAAAAAPAREFPNRAPISSR